MKIDRTRPSHWLRLVLFGINVLIARFARTFVSRAGTPDVVVLYGHKLSGNLLALQRRAEGDPSVRLVFLTMDPEYRRHLAASGIACISATSPKCIALLARARAVVSDHGLHVMEWLIGARDLRFIDVWHGIPFKGFDADDFRVQRRFDEVWVASPLLADLYVERFGFEPSRVVATGYARTDVLVNDCGDRRAVLRELGVDAARQGPVVMFAPTWAQDADQRSLYPFGIGEAEFLGRLAALAGDLDATILLRRHLNSGERIVAAPGGGRIVDVPFARHPDTERLLAASDVLVCDWSSIAFDFLLLERPTIFLDVPPPFAKGFSLGPEYRFGEVVADIDTLFVSLEEVLREPGTYRGRHQAATDAVRAEIYGDRADGRSAERGLQRLRRLLSPGR